MNQNDPQAILVVTKDQDTWIFIKKALSALRKCKLHQAINPQKGVTHLKNKPNYDLLITDEFQDLKFNALVQFWSNSKQWHKIPLILLTTEVTFAKLKLYKEYGIQHVLIHPLEGNTLFEKVKTTLGIEINFSKETIERIVKTDFFKNFNLNEIQTFLSLGYLRKFEHDDVLIQEKGTIDKLGILLQGKVGVYLVQPHSEPELITELGACSLLGETSLLTRSHSSTRVISHGKSVVFMLPYYAIQLFSDELRERLLRLIIRELSKKLHTMTQEMYPPLPDSLS
ncbi:cyclic nucleotide-binding domain-containing protein [Deltaproteobacteria bacterium TL4]